MAVRHLITILVLLATPALSWAQAVAGGRPIRVALSDCTAERGGVSGELCLELDDDTLYSCQPSAGRCDTTGEWVQVSGAGLPSGCTDAGSGVIQCAGFSSTGASTNVATEISAPGAGSSSGEHNWYWDSTSGRLCDHKNGASATHCFAFAFSHATDCTSVSGIDTGIALIAGDTCHEADADTNWIYDGTAWDQLGGASANAYLFEFATGSTAGAGYATAAYLSNEGAVSSAYTTPTAGAVSGAAGGQLNQGVAVFTDGETDTLYLRVGRIPGDVDLTNLTIEIDLVSSSSTSTGAIAFDVSFECLSAGGDLEADPNEFTFGAKADVDGTGNATAYGVIFASATGHDISSECGPGQYLLVSIALDDTTSAFSARVTNGRAYSPGS